MVSTANLAPFSVPARDQIVPLMQIVTLCPKRKYDPTTTKFAHFSPHRFRKQIAFLLLPLSLSTIFENV